MIRRLAGVLLTVCGLSVLLLANACAEVPPGPRLAVLRYVSERDELVTVSADGGQVRWIPRARELPTWSDDGGEIVFSEVSGTTHHLRRYLYRANADGSDLRRIPGTRGGLAPVLSPDGHTLAFARERMHLLNGGYACCFKATVWLLNRADHSERRITPWRSEVVEWPASFTPDGLTLAVQREEPMGADTRHTVLAMHLAGGRPTVLVQNATEPAFSPGGTRLALLVTGREEKVGGGLEVTPTHLAVAAADGSDLRELTTGQAEEWGPGWDPSGQRLAYLQYAASRTYKSFFGYGDSIMEINPDGTCRTKVLGYPNMIIYGVSWQPGPGREAGPISC
jgi:Tol biopolymer transport system component